MLLSYSVLQLEQVKAVKSSNFLYLTLKPHTVHVKSIFFN